MSILKLSELVILSFACFWLSAAWADQIVMKNGDRVTGSIVKKDGPNLTVKTDQFGIVTVSWDRVESVMADKPVNIVLQDGKTVQGTLATTEGKLEVATQTTKLRVTPAEVATIRDARNRRLMSGCRGRAGQRSGPVRPA